MSHRKWRSTKQHPSRARAGYQISCCLLSLHFLCDILSGGPVHSREIRFVRGCEKCLPVPAWLLLSKTCQPFFSPLYNIEYLGSPRLAEGEPVAVEVVVMMAPSHLTGKRRARGRKGRGVHRRSGRVLRGVVHRRGHQFGPLLRVRSH